MTNKRRKLNREQMQATLLTVIDLLNRMKTKEEILEELRKEDHLKRVSIYDVEYYIKKARNVSYGLLKQSAFTPSQNILIMMKDIEFVRKKQLEIMNGGDEIDAMTKLHASVAYLKSSILMGQVRNSVGAKLKEEERERNRCQKTVVLHKRPELKRENLQPCEIPEKI